MVKYKLKDTVSIRSNGHSFDKYGKVIKINLKLTSVSNEPAYLIEFSEDDQKWHYQSELFKVPENKMLMEYVNEFLEKYEDSLNNAKEDAEEMVNSESAEGIENCYDFLGEMASIIPDHIKINPKYKKNGFSFIMEVKQRDEGTNEPHVHLEFKDGHHPKLSYISLHSATYCNHHVKTGKIRILNAGELEELIEFFKTPAKQIFDGRNITCWQYATEVYITSFGDPNKVFMYDKNGIPIMPDYSKLNINYYNNENEDSLYLKNKKK